MTLAVREALEADASGMLAVLGPIISAGGLTTRKRTPSLPEQAAFVRGFPSDGIFLVAVFGKTVAGMQDVIPVGEGVGEISTFVALDRQRSGVGRALTEVMLGAVRAKGIRRLRASILAGNGQARRFYAAMGFVEAGPASAGQAIAELGLGG